MTIFDATHKLLKYFSENDHFELSDTKKIVIISLNESLDQAIVAAALKKLEERNIITEVNSQNDKKSFKSWVLNQPLDMYEQTITLTYPTLKAISDTVNGFCELNNIEKGKINLVEGVSENSIMDIIILLQNLLEKYKEEV